MFPSRWTVSVLVRPENQNLVKLVYSTTFSTVDPIVRSFQHPPKQVITVRGPISRLSVSVKRSC